MTQQNLETTPGNIRRVATDALAHVTSEFPNDTVSAVREFQRIVYATFGRDDLYALIDEQPNISADDDAELILEDPIFEELEAFVNELEVNTAFLEGFVYWFSGKDL